MDDTEWTEEARLKEKNVVGCGFRDCYANEQDSDLGHLVDTFEKCKSKTRDMIRELCLECVVSEGKVLAGTCQHKHPWW